jgi:hypothetical protein
MAGAEDVATTPAMFFTQIRQLSKSCQISTYKSSSLYSSLPRFPPPPPLGAAAGALCEGSLLGAL